MHRDNKRLLRVLEFGGMTYLVVVLILSLWFGSKQLAIGVFIGGILAIINFRAWQWLLTGLIADKEKGLTGILTKVLFKNMLPFLAIPLALVLFKVDPIGFALGLSAIIATIIIYAVWLMVESLMKESNEE